MHNELVRGMLAGMLVMAGIAVPAKAVAQPPRDALTAIGEAMFFRGRTLGDSLPFDACSVFEQSGRPADYLEGILPGLRSLLDRQGDDPCAAPFPAADQRFVHRVRVDSVIVEDSAARVRLHVRRGEWSHDETYYLSRTGDGWALREVRMYPGVQTLPPRASQRDEKEPAAGS
jgi:hypothetical protein